MSDRGQTDADLDMLAAETRALATLCQAQGDWDFLSFKLISKRSGLDLVTTRHAVRSLAARGYAEFARGLWTEDGTPAGSGYHATEGGRDYCRTISGDQHA